LTGFELGAALSREQLERIASGLPKRNERRIVGEEELLGIAVDDKVEERVQASEAAQLVAPIRARLCLLLRALPAEDRLLLKLHYRDGLTIASISRLLKLPQKQVYSRRDRCLKQLRRALLTDKQAPHGVKEILGSSCLEFFTDRELAWE
jgi:RNA polymerase sigma factor (sigma-70 family)